MKRIDEDCLQLQWGIHFVVTLIDSFSKWAEAAPVPGKRSSGVAKFISASMFL